MSIPTRVVVEPANGSRVHSAIPVKRKTQAKLSDLGAAALHQNSEDDRKERSGNDPNDCRAFHIYSSSDQL